jgi:hypothetical protein
MYDFFVVRQGAYPTVDRLKDILLGYALALFTKIRLGWKGLPGTNTSLLRTIVSYGCIKFLMGSEYH